MAGFGTARRLTGFGVVLAVAFAAAYGIGQAVGPVAAEPERPAAEHGHDGAPESEGGHGDTHGGGGEAAGIPAGLMVSEDGVTLDVLSTGARAGVEREFAFRILDDHGEPVTEFTPTHDKLMHLVVARRDLSGFQHVHP
ncbi:MAG TPA: hypothetical protein VNP92_32210, partial [Actinophytocola sp.]|nr:hypothetical protein [Actinophytocola sp.]